jgi:hypothetical protein
LYKALEANPLVELKAVKELPAQYEPGALYVFHRLVPAELPPGTSFVVDPLTSSDLWQTGEPLANPIVTKQEADSPLMRHVRLDNVILPQARQLVPKEGAQALVGAVSGDPLYFSFRDSARQVLVLTVNLDEGDLTFRTAFPILVTNALGWFAGPAGELQEALTTGAVASVELPADAQAKGAVLRSPSGLIRPLPPQVAKSSIGPLEDAGIWTIETGRDKLSESTQLLQRACNLSSRTESDLRPPESWRQAAQQTPTLAGFFVRPIWFYLVGGAWLVAVVEWFLYQRRWIG